MVKNIFIEQSNLKKEGAIGLTSGAGVIEYISDRLFNVVEGWLEESSHGGWGETEHSLRRPRHLLVSVFPNCVLYLTTLKTNGDIEVSSTGGRKYQLLQNKIHQM